MLADHIIETGTLVRRGDRIAVSVRLPWYRALPLSSVTGVEFEIDGIQAPTDTITFTVDDVTYKLDELPPLHTRWWYVLDSAALEGDFGPEPDANEEHAVRVRIGAYIPYLPAGPGFIAIGEQDRKTLTMTEEVSA